MTGKKTILIAAVALLAAGAIVWVVRGRQSRPNVLLITLDTTRADRLGCYGRASAMTPTLDGLAKSGTRFTRAFCNVPLTLPSHSTILTGLYPPEHGSRLNGILAISKDAPTLAELLAARGYQTAAFVAAVVLDARFGLNRGFGTYDDYKVPGPIDPQDEMALIRYRRGDEVADATLAWLKARPRKPFFCWVHFYDAHRPYYLDEPLDPPDLNRAYEISIGYVDKQIARLVDYLREADLLDNTIIVAVADHGEGLAQHGEDEHGLLLYDEVMRVPLIVRLPGARGGGTASDATVACVDITPTLVDLLHIKAPAPLSGRSFERALHGEPLPELPVYFETQFPLSEYGWSPLYGVVNGEWKYIRAPREELYDLGSDPGETNNRAASAPPELKHLQSRLADAEGRMKRRAGSEVKLDAASRRALESLGYVGGGGSTTNKAKEGLRDPKDVIWMRREFMDAEEDVREHRTARAEERLVKLVAESPESLAFHYKLGKLYFDQGRFEEARKGFEAMAKRFADSYAPHYDLGKTLIKLQRYDEAVAELALAAELDDRKVEVLNNLGLAHLYKRDMPAAMKAFQRSIAIDAKQVDPHSNLGHVLLQMGQMEQAEAEFRRALEVDPAAVGPRYNLGLALLQSARYKEAVQEFRRVIQIKPDFADAQNKLKLALEKAGTPEAPP